MSSLQTRVRCSTDEHLQAAVRRTMPLPSHEVCNSLREAVTNAATRDAASMQALRRTVRDFTFALREAGTKPETVLISLKALVSVASLPPVARDNPDWSGYALRETMSRWCIEEYFTPTAG